MATPGAPSRSPEPEVRILRPSTGWTSLGLRELARYRELLFVLAWRNIIVRYKQSVLGILWAVLQPVFLMIVFTLFFRRVAGVSSGDIPYPIFSYSGLLPWTFFAACLTQSANSLVGSAGLISKVYFPRLALPIANVLASLVDFAIAFTVLLGLMIYYGDGPGPFVPLLLPAFIGLALCAALGVGLWLAALNVAYRDVQYVVPFLVQLWLFCTPGVYLSPSFSEPWRTLIGLNPMEGVVEGFRWAILGADAPPGRALAISVAVTALLLASGAFVFRRMERTFADVV